MKPKHIGLIALAAVAGLTGCSEPADRVEITETTTRSETRPVPRVNATSDERFALARPRDQRPPVSTPTQPSSEITSEARTGSASGAFTFETPPGWQQIAPSQFRDPNFIIGMNGEIECYVSVLQGTGGGLLTNANRWRGQMGRAPFSDEEFAQLPRARVLGSEAVIVDFSGDFTGMGGGETKPGYRLVGALIQTPESAIFIKMTGPDAAVEAEKDNFALFAQSLAFASAQEASAADSPSVAPAPETSAPEAPAAAATAASAGGYEWIAPAGWTVDPAGSPMRLVTFRFGPDNVGECYVAVLPGAAGGRLENFNRWLAQMGEPPLQETEIDLQPTAMLFGEEVPMLIAKGTYTGMGTESRPGQVLYGTISTIDDESVFIKLIAPESIANDQFRNFQSFSASLKKK